MRVLMVSSEFPPGPGGIGNHAWQLALSLCRLGWVVEVVSPQDYASPAEIEGFRAQLPFALHRVSSGRNRLREAASRLLIASKVIRCQRPDVILGSGFSGVLVTTTLSRVHRLPSVAVAHGSELGPVGIVNRLLRAAAFDRASLVVAVSHFTRQLVLAVGMRPRQLEVILNAADGERFTPLPEARQREFRKAKGFAAASLLLTVGHVSERKGQEQAIRAVPLILRAVPDAHYLMIGLPTLQPELGRLADELGVGDRVHFLGRVGESELLQWLNACDLFLMTSRTTSTGDCEGFGIAVVEAALCGKPAVVTRGSGIVEAIEEGLTGLAVGEGDASATAVAVVSLLRDEPRRKAMGQAARARALRAQTWDSCGRRYDEVLRRVAA